MNVYREGKRYPAVRPHTRVQCNHVLDFQGSLRYYTATQTIVSIVVTLLLNLFIHTYGRRSIPANQATP
jgi:hypothetical protein